MFSPKSFMKSCGNLKMEYYDYQGWFLDTAEFVFVCAPLWKLITPLGQISTFISPETYIPWNQILF